MIFIGTAGWTIPPVVAAQFSGVGTYLARYARILNCVEVNSSFYRPHAMKVYAQWAAKTPDDFRFTVKLPRTVTHESCLLGIRQPLEKFVAEVSGLGEKLGALLVQLPQWRTFETETTRNFFTMLRELYAGPVVCEPRHMSWFNAEVEAMLNKFQIARAAADPADAPEANIPGGWLSVTARQVGVRPIVYYRLHGSPRPYWSRYSVTQLAAWAQEASAVNAAHDSWFIFENTANASAIENALALQEYVGQSDPIRSFAAD